MFYSKDDQRIRFKSLFFVVISDFYAWSNSIYNKNTRNDGIINHYGSVIK